MVSVIHKKLFLSCFKFGIYFVNYVNSSLLLTNLELRSLFFKDFKTLIFIITIKCRNVLLFRALRQSTIGAERLDFRVRNGIGYNTFA